jgi:hypothetical protein
MLTLPTDMDPYHHDTLPAHRCRHITRHRSAFLLHGRFCSGMLSGNAGYSFIESA